MIQTAKEQAKALADERASAESMREELRQTLDLHRKVLDAAAEAEATKWMAATAATQSEVENARTADRAARATLRQVLEATATTIETRGVSDAIVRSLLRLIAHHGKGICDALSNVIKFAIEDHFKALNRIFNRNILTCYTGKNFSNMKWLR